MGSYTDEQIEFMETAAEFRRVNGRNPTLSETLAIAMYLGYRKTAPVGEYKVRP